MTKWVYGFGRGVAEGRADMRNLLGGKGANLAEMCNLGLPVPPGFSITTEVCTAFYANDRNYPDALADQIDEAMAAVEYVEVRLRWRPAPGRSPSLQAGESCRAG